MPTQVFKFFANNGGTAEGNRRVGDKHYELKDHLGSVRVVISDVKQLNNQGDINLIDAGDNFSPQVLSFSDTYPFGMSMRSFNPNETEYGFNGMRKENSLGNGSGSHLDFDARIYDSRIGRWMSSDAVETPWMSPYVYVSNKLQGEKRWMII